MVLGGVVISYPWATALLYRLTGSPPPSEGPRRDAPPASANDVSLEGLNAAWAAAEGHVPTWQTLTLRLPNAPDAPWTFAIDTATGAIRPDRRSQLTLDRKTGVVVRFEPYESQSAGRRLRGWLRFIHTGEAFGLAGQTLAGVASAGGAVLVYTGLALALRRFWAWRRRVV